MAPHSTKTPGSNDSPSRGRVEVTVAEDESGNVTSPSAVKSDATRTSARLGDAEKNDQGLSNAAKNFEGLGNAAKKSERQGSKDERFALRSKESCGIESSTPSTSSKSSIPPRTPTRSSPLPLAPSAQSLRPLQVNTPTKTQPSDSDLFPSSSSAAKRRTPRPERNDAPHLSPARILMFGPENQAIPSGSRSPTTTDTADSVLGTVGQKSTSEAPSAPVSVTTSCPLCNQKENLGTKKNKKKSAHDELLEFLHRDFCLRKSNRIFTRSAAAKSASNSVIECGPSSPSRPSPTSHFSPSATRTLRSRPSTPSHIGTTPSRARCAPTVSSVPTSSKNQSSNLPSTPSRPQTSLSRVVLTPAAARSLRRPPSTPTGRTPTTTCRTPSTRQQSSEASTPTRAQTPLANISNTPSARIRLLAATEFDVTASSKRRWPKDADEVIAARGGKRDKSTPTKAKSATPATLCRTTRQLLF